MVAARRLGRPHPGARGLPRLLAFTDPARTPDVLALAARLPRGAGLVYRAFGASDGASRASALARIAGRQGVTLFIGADVAIATAAGAAGVHLPERLARRRGWITALRSRFLVTAAAHDLPAIRRAKAAGVSAVIISPVFPSRSPSAGRPLGVTRFARLVREAGLPVYALGGVTLGTAPRLRGTGAHGLAAVDAFRSAADV
jgi:thiamine-phosphate pyrophosphorylase